MIKIYLIEKIVILLMFLSLLGCSGSGFFGKSLPQDTFIDNMSIHKKELFELRTHVENITQNNQKIRFGFDNSETKFWVNIKTDSNGNSPFIREKMSINSSEMEETLSILGWSKEELRIMINLMKKVDAETVMTSASLFNTPIHISFDTKGYSSSFECLLYNRNLILEEKNQFLKMEGYYLYDDSTVIINKYPL